MNNQTRHLHIRHIIIMVMCSLLAVASISMGQAKEQKSTNRSQHLTQRTTTMNRFQADVQPSKAIARQAATPCDDNGMAGSYPCSNVDLSAFMPFSDMSGGTSKANDIWGWTDSTSGREFAILGRTNGTEFIEVTDPENPVHLGNLPTHTTSSTWRDVKTHGNYAIIGSEAGWHGMQIFDLTQLLSVTSPITFSHSAHFDGFGSSHNVVSNEESDFVYGVGSNTCSGGLHMINMSDPLNPADAGCFSEDGYTHDAQCVIYSGPDSDHTGKEICLNSNEDTLTIVDVTDKSAPVQLSRSTYDDTGYAHQGWLTEDMAYFLLDDETDEMDFGDNTKTFIWDVTDLDNPNLINTYVASNPAIDHNLYIKGDKVYQANYRAGLRILDAADVSNGTLSEIGYFDVYPADNDASFNGAWSVYPYFDSGTVIVSSIETGLFVLKPTFSPPSALTSFALINKSATIEQCVGQQNSTPLSLIAQNGFGNPISLTLDDIPNGVLANLDNTTITPSNPVAEFMLDITNNGGALGTYSITIMASGGGIDRTTMIDLLLIGSTAVAPTLQSPAANSMSSTVPQFRWAAVDGATSYLIEIASSADFTTIIDTQTVTTPAYTLSTTLNPNTPYYWRVTVENACGGSATTDVSTFTTANQSQVCANPNAAIPDASTAGLSNSLTVDGLSGEILDLDVSLTVPHTYIGDLGVQLIHVDSGIAIILFNQVGDQGLFTCSGDLIDVVLNDSVPDKITETCEQEIIGSFQSEQPLSAFEGLDVSGEWQLTLVDREGPDTGVLESWCLLPTLNTQGTGEPIVTEMPTTAAPTATPTTDPTPTPSSPLTIGTRNVTEQQASSLLMVVLVGGLVVVGLFVGRKYL